MLIERAQTRLKSTENEPEMVEQPEVFLAWPNIKNKDLIVIINKVIQTVNNQQLCNFRRIEKIQKNALIIIEITPRYPRYQDTEIPGESDMDRKWNGNGSEMDRKQNRISKNTCPYVTCPFCPLCCYVTLYCPKMFCSKRNLTGHQIYVN